MSLTWHTCPHCKRKHLGRLVLRESPDSVCTDCLSVNDSKKWTSENALRCPHCRSLITDDLWEYDIYTEDGAEVSCGDCGKDFEVTTRITYEFTSPALEKAK